MLSFQFEVTDFRKSLDFAQFRLIWNCSVPFKGDVRGGLRQRVLALAVECIASIQHIDIQFLQIL